MDNSPRGSSVHGILQARILEWVAIPFSRGSSQLRDQTWVSYISGRFFTVWVITEALYNIVVQYFYILQNDHHNKSSYHLSPYKMITVSLTIFPMFYVISLWIIYSITGSLYLFITLSCFTQPPHTLHSAPSHPSLSTPTPFTQPTPQPGCSPYLWVCFCFVIFVLFF